MSSSNSTNVGRGINELSHSLYLSLGLFDRRSRHCLHILDVLVRRQLVSILPSAYVDYYYEKQDGSQACVLVTLDLICSYETLAGSRAEEAVIKYP